jgi:hypothetical protein
MQKQMIWLSYDLGVDGDYENLYAWLDHKEAKECGDNVAAFKYDYLNDFEEKIKSDIEQHISLRKNDRIYIIFRDDNQKMKGKFIFGGRKKAPWSGYAVEKNGSIEDYL